MSPHKPTKTIVVLVIVLAALTGIPFLTPISSATGAQIWSYTALGDSLAFGALALPFRGYTFLYRGALQSDTGNTVFLSNLGVPGWTSSDLLNALHSSFIFRTAVRNSQVITWNIGGNDLQDARSSYKAGTCGGSLNRDCLQAAVAQIESNWKGIVVELKGLRDFKKTIVRTMDIYNPYVVQDKAADSWPDPGNDFQVLKFYLDQVDAFIAQQCALVDGIPFAQVYAAFNGPGGDQDPGKYISFDGLHPNDLGHAVMAQLLRKLGYAPLFP
jgi:lysophospholipase L1-like esterase